MVETVYDPLELSDALRAQLGKAATRIELPLLTHDQGDALAPSDWRDIFDAVKAWVRDCEFEALGRAGDAATRHQALRDARETVRKASAVEFRTRTLNRELRFIRQRARQAAADRKQERLDAKVKAIKSFGGRAAE